MSEMLLQLEEMVKQLERRKEIYRAEYYQPYKYQLNFHHALGYKSEKLSIYRFLIAANKIGKSLCACFEDSYHLTGQYPSWWKGHRFPGPVKLLICGVTNETVRDSSQQELLGDPTDDSKLGTGTVPIDCIGKRIKKSGVANCVDSIKIKHVSGLWSTIYFRAYEQGFKKFMAVQFDVVHADEEAPADIWSQMKRSMFAKKQAIAYCTFTAEEGMTELVDQALNHPTEGQAVITGTWKDARHMVDENGNYTEFARLQLESMPQHERDLRVNGLPLSGAGMVYPTQDDKIRVAPFEIPSHWARINGIDFGWDHPFAAASLAHDRDNDCIYVTNTYSESRALPAIHSQAIKAWGEWIPVAWPHDGLNSEKSTGDEQVKAYRDVGLNCLPNRSTNPPEIGKEEGTGGNSVESSIQEIMIRMETGRFKVFSTCTEFFAEKQLYHRNPKRLIVKVKDDVLDAVRMACMMMRHAKVNTPKLMGRTSTTRDGTRYLSARPNKRR
jgi:phage terminase large subunit-like protein